MPATAASRYSGVIAEESNFEFFGEAASANLPSGFGRPRETDFRTEAIHLRRAARLNAAQIDRREFERLLSDRQDLIVKKFDGGLTRDEERKLNFIRWSLDRILDAQNGESLDILEGAIARYENFADDIRTLRQEISGVMGKRQR